MNRFGTAVVFFLLGVLTVPVAAWLYLNYGHPPVAVDDPSFPLEAQIVHIPLHRRIHEEMPAASPVPVNNQTLAAGATIYMQQCAGCHGQPGKPAAFAKMIFPGAPQLWERHHGGKVVGVSDDPVGAVYWHVKNGVRLSAMPSYRNAMSDTEMWEVSNLLKAADQPMPAAVQAILAEPAK